jgi:hypothetical protein
MRTIHHNRAQFQQPASQPTPDHLFSRLLAEYDSLTCLTLLLKDEQQLILNRQIEALSTLLPRIEEQLSHVRINQAQREDLFRVLLAEVPDPIPPGITSRVQLLSPGFQEHCIAMARQVDTQVQLVHEVAWQNHVLLSQSVHFLQQVLTPWLGSRQESLSIYGVNGSVQKESQRESIFQGVA